MQKVQKIYLDFLKLQLKKKKKIQKLNHKYRKNIIKKENNYKKFIQIKKL